MKILVIQFARLGDIYMSWPAARALRRKYPDAEIHLLVRPRFEAATKGLDAVDRIVAFPTGRLLEPLLGESEDLDEARRRTAEAVDSLRDEDYDLIVNWTFSPLSSWLVKSISSPRTEALGYNRHRDGSLLIADDVSAFFYAQVGTERPNRIHLTDLFATMIDMDLVAEDWRAPRFESSGRELPKAYWVLHAGASEDHKRIEPWQWARLIQEYAGFAGDEALPVVLIGSAEEKPLAKAVQAGVNRVPIVDLTGETTLTEIFGVLEKARLLVGADSAPLHMASLTGAPTFNISAGAVNFWETGPKSARAWVYRLEKDAGFPSALLGARTARLLAGEAAEDLLEAAPGVPAYRGRLPTPDGFAWEMIQALYLGADFPMADDLRFIQVVEKMREMNDVLVEQLENPKVQIAALAQLMESADEVFRLLGAADPAAGVMVRWLQTEKIRIGPSPAEQVRARMLEYHRRFAAVLRPYCLEESADEGAHGTL